MSIVTEEELEKAKKEANKIDTSGIQTVIYGTKKFWIGASGIKYDNLSEALDSIQRKNEKDSLKNLGLNEHGQTPEQMEQAKKKVELLKKKEAILKQAAEIDSEIMNVGKVGKVGIEKPKKKK